MFPWTAIGVLVSSLLLPIEFPEDFRIWTDISGKFKVEARLKRVDDSIAFLETEDGREIEVPVDRLSQADQDYILSLDPAPGDSSKSADSPANSPGKVKYSEVMELSRILYRSEDINAHLDFLLNAPGIEQVERDKATRAKSKWQKLSDAGAQRVGTKWLTRSEQSDAAADGDQLLVEAGIQQQAGNLEEAARQLERLAARDPSRADQAYYEIGMLYLLVGRTAVQAEPHFHRCVRLLEDELHYQDPSARRNLAAALNNLAVCKLRTDEMTDAMTYLKQSIEMYPFAESKHNLARATAVAHANFYFSSGDTAAPKLRRLMEDLHVRQSDYSEEWGWRLIPFFEAQAELWYTPEDETRREEEIEKLGNKEKALLAARQSAGERWLRGFISSGTYLTLANYFESEAFQTQIEADYLKNRLGYAQMLQRSDVRWAIFVSPKILLLPGRNSGNLNEIEILPQGADLSLTAQKIATHDNWDLLAYRLIEGTANSFFRLADGPTESQQLMWCRYDTSHRLSVTPTGQLGDLQFYKVDEVPEELSARVLLDRQGHVSGIPVERFVDPRVQTQVAAVSAAKVRAWLLQEGVTQQELDASPPLRLTDAAGERVGSSLLYLQSKYPQGDDIAIQAYQSSTMNDPWCFYCRGTQWVDCRQCIDGIDTQEQLRTVTKGGMSIQVKETVRVPCDVCKGKGRLACNSPGCDRGVQLFNPRWLAPLPR